MIYFDSIASGLGVSLFVLGLILVWSAIWKLFAMWKSARRNSPVWFVLLFLINTIGILDILYIYVFSEIGKRKKAALESRTVKKSSKRIYDNMEKEFRKTKQILLSL